MDVALEAQPHGAGVDMSIGQDRKRLTSHCTFAFRGAKAAMQLAMMPELSDDLIGRLVVVDMSPAPQNLGSTFSSYLQAMIRAEQKGCKTSKEVDLELRPAVPVRFPNLPRGDMFPSLREFGSGFFFFRLPLHHWYSGGKYPSMS